MIAARQLSYLGKMVRNHDETHLPMKLLTAWVNNKRPVGGVLYTNKRGLVNSLELILPVLPPRPEADDNSLEMKRWKRVSEERRTGNLRHWISIAQDERYWEWLIDQKLRRPQLDIPCLGRRNQPHDETPPQPLPETIKEAEIHPARAEKNHHPRHQI